MTGEANEHISVAVVEEHEILRRGLVASLEEDDRLMVVSSGCDLAVDDVDVAVVSCSAAGRGAFGCPIVVYSDQFGEPDPGSSSNTIAGILNRRTLTAAQLRATVHAAFAGLQVQVNGTGSSQHPVGRPPPMEARARQVLELLAEGLSTREIAVRMSYSERTIKKLITTLEERFHARNRAQVVAQAIRRGLI